MDKKKFRKEYLRDRKLPDNYTICCLCNCMPTITFDGPSNSDYVWTRNAGDDVKCAKLGLEVETEKDKNTLPCGCLLFQLSKTAGADDKWMFISQQRFNTPKGGKYSPRDKRYPPAEEDDKYFYISVCAVSR